MKAVFVIVGLYTLSGVLIFFMYLEYPNAPPRFKKLVEDVIGIFARLTHQIFHDITELFVTKTINNY